MLYKFDINLAKCNTNGMDESYIGPCFSSTSLKNVIAPI